MLLSAERESMLHVHREENIAQASTKEKGSNEGNENMKVFHEWFEICAKGVRDVNPCWMTAFVTGRGSLFVMGESVI